MTANGYSTPEPSAQSATHAGPKRKRASKPKLKTGCFTCKVRRIKCDETKPLCFRCTSTGRQCDGYPIYIAASDTGTPAESTAVSELRRPEAQPLSRERSQPPSPASGISCWQGDFDQLRSLYYFRQCTSPQFSTFQLDKSFWEYLVPLLSYAVPMVRAAASALGAAHEICISHGAPKTLSSELDHRRRQTFYLDQYGRAIWQMQQNLDGQICGPAPVLVTCALLIYVELLQGNRVNALVHLQGGLSVFKGINETCPPDDVRLKTFGAAVHGAHEDDADIVNGDLIHLFRRLDLQASSYLMQRPVSLLTDESLSFTETKTIFTNLQEASNTLTALAHKCYHFTACAAPYKYQPRSCVPFHLLLAQEYHLKQLDRWEKCLQNTLMQVQALGTTTDSYTHAQMLANVLTLTLHATYIYTATILSPFETSYDAHFGRFENIIHKSDMVLACRTMRASNISSDRLILDYHPNSFTPSTIVLQPLYFTATRFRHSTYRRYAVRLMSLVGMEGPWDGRIMSKVAKEVVRLEERMANVAAAQSSAPSSILSGQDVSDRPGLFEGRKLWSNMNTPVPETARFHGVGLNIDPAARKVELECSHLKADAFPEVALTMTGAVNCQHVTDMDLRDKQFWSWRRVLVNL